MYFTIPQFYAETFSLPMVSYEDTLRDTHHPQLQEYSKNYYTL